MQPQSAADDPAIITARTRVGAPARATISAVLDLHERGRALLDAPEALRELARRQLDELGDDDLQARLGETPVSALREVAGKGVRLGQLEEAGYRTVSDVLAARPAELQEVRGVGPRSARQLTRAARAVAARVPRDGRVRFDPDRRPPGQTGLLAVLAAIRQADEAASKLRPELDAFVSATAPLVADAERATSRVAMFFSSRPRKDAALSALARLDAIMTDPRVAALRQAIDRYEPAVDPRNYRSDELWRHYEADAASYNALLSTVFGAGPEAEREAAQGYVTPELRQKITATPLDTSRLTATLRGYQVFGAQYAIHQERSMLGDEMGLGKTVQALAVLAHLAANGQRRFLVVCPASVQVNWLNEIAKHSRLTGYSLHGDNRDEAARRWLDEGGVAVTTFGTLGRMPEVLAADVAMLVVDEAHLVKNPDTERARVVRQVAKNAQRAMFLTGTPMENRVEEFRNLVDHLQPQVAARVHASDAVAGARAFRRAVAPVYLRRNQEDVLTELPDKIEVEDWVQASADDEAAYVSAVRARNMMAMRQAGFRGPNSAKLDRLVELVEEAGEDGMKVVVFSYFLDVLATVRKALGPPVVGVITGAVSPAERQEIVDRFTSAEGHAVLLCQIEAGGVGLNIQAASLVILAEPQWKPSTEHQAIGRAYRMGQVRKVQVHRLLAKGTVDERLREVQEQKRLLFDEFARKSEVKDSDPRAVDRSEHRPAALDDETVPLESRVILAEEHRLGIR